MSEGFKHLIGRKAYKNHDGLFGKLAGIVRENDSLTGVTPLFLELLDGTRLGAFPSDLILIEEGDDIMSEHFDAKLWGTSRSDTTERVGFKRLTEDAIIPTKAHAADSGFDLYAAEDAFVGPGETVVVSTGIAVALPAGCEAQVRPRSGVTAKTKLRVQLGTIDNGYSGDIGVIVDNNSTDTWSNACRRIDNSYVEETRGKYKGYLIKAGDRIAQLVVQELPNVTGVEVESLEVSDRGAGGFGSSGI